MGPFSLTNPDREGGDLISKIYENFPSGDTLSFVKCLLTFACYGCHLPGERDGIVNGKRNRQVDPFVALSPQLSQAVRTSMKQPQYVMDSQRANAVLAAMRETCEFRGWRVYAIHVRTNHVHAVLEGLATPERMLNDLKAYASRKLNEMGWDPPAVKRWARHGSTRYLNDERSLAAAIRYVVEEQRRSDRDVRHLKMRSPP